MALPYLSPHPTHPPLPRGGSINLTYPLVGFATQEFILRSVLFCRIGEFGRFRKAIDFH